jgi:hypothetical protein
MAIVNLSYCNASFAETVYLEYDDVAHEIVSSELGATCLDGLYSGSEIYSHVDGGYRYRVLTQNFGNYAYVVSELVETCSTNISSATPTNATNEVTANGIITITATGNGVKSYSLDGITWQTSNVFTGLLPGVYTARVRNLFGGSYCYDTESVTVGFDVLSNCDLELGNVATTPGPGGTLTILDYSTTVAQPVEYRLDAGAWQNSPVFTGLAVGTYSVQIRFRNFTSCSDSRNVTLNACDLTLQAVNVTHEQTKYGDDGIITIVADGAATPFQYSIDDGASYQSGNQFTDLEPGVYLVRVKDDNDCEVFRSVELLPYKRAVVTLPLANAMRFVVTDGPVKDNGPQNFDNTLFEDMRFTAREHECFKQPFVIADLVPYQWRSSYSTHTVKIYNSSNVLQATLTPVKRTAYMGQTETLDANFSNYGSGKTQIWFPTGLPGFIEIGQDITIAGQPSINGTYEIEDIVAGTLAAEGFQSIIVTANYTEGTDPITGTVAITYDIEDFDVWEVAVDLALSAGTYYLLIEGTDDQFDDFTAQSEPIEVLATDDELVKLQWRNVDNSFLIDYGTGIDHLAWLAEAELIPGEPGGEKEVMEDSQRRVVKLRENVTRIVQLNVFDVPPWLMEKLKLALAHDVCLVNGVQYEAVDTLGMELPNPLGMLCNITVKLRQVEFLAENSDDDGDVDGVALDLGGGTILELEP